MGNRPFTVKDMFERGFIKNNSAINPASKTNLSNGQENYVQIEIGVALLQRLIIENKLSAEELHCLNTRSKSVVWQALLDSLTLKKPYSNGRKIARKQ